MTWKFPSFVQENGHSRKFWAYDAPDGRIRVQEVRAFPCKENPLLKKLSTFDGQVLTPWWVPELGFILHEGVHLFDTEAGAIRALFVDLQAKGVLQDRRHELEPFGQRLKQLEEATQ